MAWQWKQSEVCNALFNQISTHCRTLSTHLETLPTHSKIITARWKAFSTGWKTFNAFFNAFSMHFWLISYAGFFVNRVTDRLTHLTETAIRRLVSRETKCYCCGTFNDVPTFYFQFSCFSCGILIITCSYFLQALQKLLDLTTWMPQI